MGWWGHINIQEAKKPRAELRDGLAGPGDKMATEGHTMARPLGSWEAVDADNPMTSRHVGACSGNIAASA